MKKRKERKDEVYLEPKSQTLEIEPTIPCKKSVTTIRREKN
jgi:hypothetical protein